MTTLEGIGSAASYAVTGESMDKALGAANTLLETWLALVNQRRAEINLQPFGLDLQIDDITSLYKEWIVVLNTLSSRTRRLDPIANALSDAGLAKLLSDLNALLINARANGFGWIQNSGNNLEQRLSAISMAIQFAAVRRSEITKQLAKNLSEESVKTAAALAQAAPLAESILDKRDDVLAALDDSSSIANDMKEESERIKVLVAAIDSLKGEVESAKSLISDRQVEVETLYSQVLGFRTQAEAKAGELDRKLVDLVDETDSAKDQVTKAMGALGVALNDAREQGLAGAFTDRSKAIKGERTVWGALFACSLILLLILAIDFAANLDTFTYQALLVSLLRKLGLAAPMIWVGWYAAKQIGRLARIQEDYEYKAATALAFQSYRAETASVDEKLVTELLQKAIVTFGENPVRLYGDEHHDPVSPVSELLKRLDTDESFKLLKKLAGLNSRNE